ncbi:hypothetical protein AQJ43_36910 [Streptomyces avermitilis]|nr:hypothetical protein AQJ43_36910 [Streptomyces avermitilis]
MDSGFRQSPADVRLMRRRQARWHRDHDGRGGMTPEEEAIKERNAARLTERELRLWLVGGQRTDHAYPLSTGTLRSRVPARLQRSSFVLLAGVP